MIEKFKNFFEEFKGTKLWQDMEATCENSPWHREANVAVHTQMIMDHYYANMANDRTPRQQILTLLCILFHDTGKPHAMKDKHTEERGHYKSFGGHEHISARLFEDYAVENWCKWKQLQKTFDLKDTDMYLIMWVIENHLPHNFTKPESLQNIKNQLHSKIFDDGELATVYYDQILCDQAGRLSDNQEKNMAEVVTFVETIKSLKVDDGYAFAKANDAPEIVLMVGASGSGKSTYCNDLRENGYAYVSLDALRIEYGTHNGAKGKDAIELYRKCFEYCDKHRSVFRHFADKRFDQYLKEHKNIVVDNTNVNRKSRENYISAAKGYGYNVVTALFPINKAKLIERAKTRTDKQVPINAVLDQYSRITMPWLNHKDDADIIVIITSNIDGA